MYEAPPTQQQQPVRLEFFHPRVWATWLVFGLNIFMYLYAMIQGFSLMGSTVDDVFILITLGAKFTPLIDIEGQWWRLFTAIILHGGLIHLLFNSYALYILGPEVERLYGPTRFFVIYLIAGFTGSVASYGFGEVRAPAIGASGAIFGLMGGIGAFSYTARSTLGEMAQRILQRVVALAAINLVIGFSLAGVDNYAHLGGLAGGAIVGLLLAPRLRFSGDMWQPRIIAERNRLIGWAGAIILVAIVVALTWFIHTNRLTDPSMRVLLEELVLEYRFFLTTELPTTGGIYATAT